MEHAFLRLHFKGREVACYCFLLPRLMLSIVSDASVRNLTVLVWIPEFSQTAWPENMWWGTEMLFDRTGNEWWAASKIVQLTQGLPRGQVSPAVSACLVEVLPPLLPQIAGILNLFKWIHIPYGYVNIP